MGFLGQFQLVFPLSGNDELGIQMGFQVDRGVLIVRGDVFVVNFRVEDFCLRRSLEEGAGDRGTGEKGYGIAAEQRTPALVSPSVFSRPILCRALPVSMSAGIPAASAKRV
jgi:hypothetical protein